MSRTLILRTARNDAVTKDVGDNVYLRGLSDEYKVFAFYYPAAMRDEELEASLRRLGELTGENLFVNIGKLDDPSFARIVKTFGIDRYPVVVMTSTSDLAGIGGEDLTAFVRIDESHLVNDPARLVALLQDLFGLFLRGEIAAAMAKAKKKQRLEIAREVAAAIGGALKRLGKFVAERDLKVSVMDGSFELTKSGN